MGEKGRETQNLTNAGDYTCHQVESKKSNLVLQGFAEMYIFVVHCKAMQFFGRKLTITSLTDILNS